MLVVINAPGKDDPYYASNYNDIINFDIEYALKVMGRDNIVVVAGKGSYCKLQESLPDDILIGYEILDIWMRDFTTMVPKSMVEFGYDRPSEPEIQQSFDDFNTRFGLTFTKNSMKMDGGNMVDNNLNKAVLTEKIFDRNPLMTENQITTQITSSLGLSEVAYIPMDEEFLGHSDGMVMFVEDNIMIVINYTDPDFFYNVTNALETQLTGVTYKYIIGEGYGAQVGDYASACGIYVNAVVTNKYIYMPTFNDAGNDTIAKTIIETSGTSKIVVSVDSSGVCGYGGNVRCLSWQLTGSNAQKIIEAARLDYYDGCTSGSYLVGFFVSVFVLLVFVLS